MKELFRALNALKVLSMYGSIFVNVHGTRIPERTVLTKNFHYDKSYALEKLEHFRYRVHRLEGKMILRLKIDKKTWNKIFSSMVSFSKKSILKICARVLGILRQDVYQF